MGMPDRAIISEPRPRRLSINRKPRRDNTGPVRISNSAFLFSLP